MVNHSGVWGLTGCAAFKNEMDIQARDQLPYYFRERERARESERERQGTRREEREQGIGAGERGKPGGESTLERRT